MWKTPAPLSRSARIALNNRARARVRPSAGSREALGAPYLSTQQPPSDRRIGKGLLKPVRQIYINFMSTSTFCSLQECELIALLWNVYTCSTER